MLLQGIGLSSVRTPTFRPLDIGSLRAGGATHLLMLCEDSELVRRRGRWLAPRTMEIYLQEASSTQHFPSLNSATKARILSLALAFPELLRQAQNFQKVCIPATTWHTLFLRMKTDGDDGKAPGRSFDELHFAANRDATLRKAEKKT